MQIYLVGGAVRDHLLGIPVKEKDWVVVGATVDDMLRLGFRPVGKDFPVFLHPETNEEYALARTERKVGRGYTGFNFNASPDVTLEEDLKRRDLTINAMAMRKEDWPHGKIIDPYHGQADLEHKLLRHVSSAFVEDPVRILRVARFAARYAELGFKVAPETLELMQQMVHSGEVDALVAERVWKELEKALVEKNPEQFFLVLEACGALNVLFPQESLGLKTLMTATKQTSDAQIRFAALLHQQAEDVIKKLCERYRVPSDYRELAILVARHYQAYPARAQLTAENANAIVLYFLSIDAYRREERFRKFLQTCEIISSYSSADLLLECYLATKSIDTAEFINAGITGKDLQTPIQQKRIEIIAELLRAKL